MKKRRKDDFDVRISHYYSSSAGGFVTSNRLADGEAYRAMETHGGGAVLRPLSATRDDDLASIRFSKEIFSLLVRKKKRKDETVRAALERIITEATDVR
jgi:hypothetical protein